MSIYDTVAELFFSACGIGATACLLWAAITDDGPDHDHHESHESEVDSQRKE